MKTLPVGLIVMALAIMFVAPLGVSAAPPRPMADDIDGTTINAEPIPAASTAVVAGVGLRLREGPSTSDSILLILRNGESVYPCAGPVWEDGRWWAYVYAYRGDTRYEGFCAAQYLAQYDDIPDQPAAPGAAMQYKVTAYYGLKLREGAGTAYPLVVIAPYGTLLHATTHIISADGYDWAEILYAGKQLWAVTDHLSQVN